MTTTARLHPDPIVSLESERYWEATREGVLLLKRCRDCGRTHHYPRAVCPGCLSGDTEWYRARGRGTVYTFSVMRRASPPYVIAYVTLDEGVTMMTRIVGCDPDRLAIGDAVEVTFEPTEGGHALPVFRPLGDADGSAA
jgi:uncharacterized OB-fold protein